MEITNKKLISIIIPFFNEETLVTKFLHRLNSALDNSNKHYDFEFICINDGSSDKTLSLLKQQQSTDAKLKIINFSRNFGKEAAITAGLDYAKGAAIIPIDSDLQHPPETIPEMIAEWEAGYKVVVAVPKHKHRLGFLRRNLALAFYKVTHYFSDVPLPQDEGDFRLLDRRVVESIKQMKEKNRFMKGIFSWVGFSKTIVYFKQENRANGQNKWRFVQLWKLALDGFFSLTTTPLKIWTYVGITISFFAFIYILVILFKVLLHGSDVPGYASIITVILFLGGIQLISLGVIGEYIGRIYIEIKGRPSYIVEEFYDSNN